MVAASQLSSELFRPAKEAAMLQSEIEAVRALLTSKPRPVGWAERRQRLDDVGSVWPVAGDVKLTAVDIRGVPGEWSIVPGSDTSCVLMFFHGGGYCSGSILSHRRMFSEAGRAARMRTLSIAYRLAPEHPFPAAFDDALTTWRFLRSQGVSAARIAIGGDSAGGGLTVALINQLRDAQEELPACAWLVSPWTDLTMSGSTLATKDAVDPIIHRGYLGELADAYLPAGMDRKDPRVSPLYADLRSFPPTLNAHLEPGRRALAAPARLPEAIFETVIKGPAVIWGCRRPTSTTLHQAMVQHRVSRGPAGFKRALARRSHGA
jgi:epsilon-lactone hydrolase